SLALPSTAGATTRTLRCPPCNPATSVRRALGCTCRISVSRPRAGSYRSHDPGMQFRSEHAGERKFEGGQRPHQHYLTNDEREQRRKIHSADRPNAALEYTEEWPWEAREG